MRRRAQDERAADLVQHIVFRLAGEEYALPLLSVREIVRLESVVPVPKAPAALRGVMSLRGERVPVVDLAVVFGCGVAEPTAESCVLVGEARIDEARAPLGLAADGVSRVLDLAPAEIAAPPRLGGLLAVDFIRAMARVETGFVPILDVDGILASDELRRAVGASRAEGASGPEPEALRPDSVPTAAGALTATVQPADVITAGEDPGPAAEMAEGGSGHARGRASGDIEGPRGGRSRPRGGAHGA